MILSTLELIKLVINYFLRLDIKKSLRIGVKHKLDYYEHCSKSFNEYMSAFLLCASIIF